MATVKILQAIITQIKDVQQAEDDGNPDSHLRSETFYDLGEAVWHLEAAIRRMQARRG